MQETTHGSGLAKVREAKLKLLSGLDVHASKLLKTVGSI